MRRDLPRGAGALLLGLSLIAGPVQAQDDDRALTGFARNTAPLPRSGPVDPLDWEQRLRPADRFSPPRLREADAALLAAARDGRWADAAALLKAGQASANARDAIGGHVLVLAARAGQDELLRLLLQRGADIDRTGEDGFTALGAAAFAGQRGTVRLLLRAGADAQRWGAGGQTALHLASLAGRLDVLDELLRGGVPVDLLNRQRDTALDVAASTGRLDAMDHLIQAGADTRQAGNR